MTRPPIFALAAALAVTAAAPTASAKAKAPKLDKESWYGFEFLGNKVGYMVARDEVKEANAVAEADGSVPLRVVDCGEGGLGLRGPFYLPRGAEATLAVDLTEEGRSVTREVRVRVQRTTMIARSPVYYLGTSFVDLSEAAPIFIGLLHKLLSPDKGSIGWKVKSCPDQYAAGATRKIRICFP